MEITAAVATGNGQPFSLETATIEDPRPDEVLVEIVGAGLCHTDLAARDGHLPFPLPGVLGHEGSGVVVAVGRDVRHLTQGDKVALSFNFCGNCTACCGGLPAYCREFLPRNFGGTRADGSSGVSRSGVALGANFFGQSSFATHALAAAHTVVTLPPDAPVDLAAPLGCGIQTGAGVVLNSLDCREGSSLVVLGGGSVGLAAVLAASVRGLAQIIVVEPFAGRRELASSLGATHVIDPAAGTLGEQIRAVVPEGAQYVVDTTGRIPVIEGAIAGLGHKAKVGLIGVPSDPAHTLNLGLSATQVTGLSVVGICEGDSNPPEFIPELLGLHADGQFPFDKLITTMPLSRINEAVDAQQRGDVVKIVLQNDLTSGS